MSYINYTRDVTIADDGLQNLSLRININYNILFFRGTHSSKFCSKLYEAKTFLNYIKHLHRRHQMVWLSLPACFSAIIEYFYKFSITRQAAIESYLIPGYTCRSLGDDCRMDFHKLCGHICLDLLDEE